MRVKRYFAPSFMIINSIVRELKANGDMSMDYLSHNVSENLKRIRQSKGMSLDQVAEQTDRKSTRLNSSHAT